MNCPVCGGKLQIENSVYLCENCGNKQQIETFFEDTEVFICYVESDEHGRRTKDSILAQELYNKLASYNIKCFYQRISTADLSETDYQNAYEEAIQKSKIIIVLSISNDNFNKILEYNSEYFTGKTVIPIYSEMSAYDIPRELNSLQCVNYDNIGTADSLAKNILHILGRENEIDVAEILSKQQSKKRKILISILCITLISFIGVGAYIIFGTPYILKSRKYNYAEKLVAEGKNIAAIEQLIEIEDYANSRTLLKKIYDIYTGYYRTEDEKYNVYFKISDNLNLTLEVTYYDEEGGTVSFSSEAVLEQADIKYQFVDNLRNLGNYRITLFDDGFDLMVHTEEKNDDVYIRDITYTFKLSEKADAPLQEKIDRDMIMEWLKKGVSKDDLISLGFVLEKLYQLNDGVDEYLYSINNTDIRLAILTDYNYIYSKETNEVSGFLIPARIIIPDKIGMSDKPFFEDDILYIPNGDIGNFSVFSHSKDIINRNTVVVVTSRKLIDNTCGDSGTTIDDIIEYYHLLQDTRNKQLFRVRKSADDSSSQIGAYTNLDNAKKDADNHKSEGYKVYDDNGNLVYEP